MRVPAKDVSLTIADHRAIERAASSVAERATAVAFVKSMMPKGRGEFLDDTMPYLIEGVHVYAFGSAR